jgi:hypothetical protein
MTKRTKRAKKRSGLDLNYLKNFIMLSIMLSTVDSAEAITDPSLLPAECPQPSSNGANAKIITEVVVYPDYPSITAHNVTNVEKYCTWKTVGINKGRICCWDDVWHFLKYEQDHSRLLEMYNILLVRNNFNLTAPKVEYIYNDYNKLAISSERILDLATAKRLIRINKDNYRKNIILKIGEKGFAQLHAVSSVISDTIAPENWGYTSQGLVFIDLDGGKYPQSHAMNGTSMQPKTLEGYLSLGRSIFEHDKSRHAFTLNNLIEMQKIYSDMIEKPVPKLHPAVDMSERLYRDIFTSYSEVLKEVINNIQNDFRNLYKVENTQLYSTSGSKDDEPHIEYNDMISWALEARIKQIAISPAIPEHIIANSSVMPDLNNATSQLANLTASVVSATMLVNQTILNAQNSSNVQALIANTSSVIANATSIVAKTAMSVAIDAQRPVTNEMLYNRIDRLDNSMSVNFMFHTAALLLTASLIGAYVMYRSKATVATLGTIFCCKKPKHRTVPTLRKIIIDRTKTPNPNQHFVSSAKTTSAKDASTNTYKPNKKFNTIR